MNIRWLYPVGKPMCINCGYILTGVDDSSRPCSECGELPETVQPKEAA